MFYSILCTHIKYYRTNSTVLQEYWHVLFYGKLLFCLLQFINYFTFVTDSDWSSEQLVSDFSPTGHFKNECLNIHTYILFVSIFSYKNTSLCITLHTQVQECCWDLKNPASRKISRKFVSWNSAEKMWLAGSSAEFLLSQPKLNKKFGWGIYLCSRKDDLSTITVLGQEVTLVEEFVLSPLSTQQLQPLLIFHVAMLSLVLLCKISTIRSGNQESPSPPS